MKKHLVLVLPLVLMVGCVKPDDDHGKFPVSVVAEVSRGMHIAMMMPNGIDSPEYVVNLRLTNTGSVDISYSSLKIRFGNPTTGEGLTNTVLKCGKGFDDRNLDMTNKEAYVDAVLRSHETEKHETSTNGYTYQLLRGLGKGEEVILLLEIMGKGDTVLAAYGCHLPDLSELPSQYGDKKMVIEVPRCYKK